MLECCLVDKCWYFRRTCCLLRLPWRWMLLWGKSWGGPAGCFSMLAVNLPDSMVSHPRTLIITPVRFCRS